MSPGNSHDAPGDAFDRAMRALHRDAVAHVSPDARRRLRHARDPARTRRSTTRLGWATAGAVAVALALAVALPLRPPAPEAPRISSTTTTRERASAPRTGMLPRAAAPASADADHAPVPTALAALEESPDFYLWLASNDAAADGVLP